MTDDLINNVAKAIYMTSREHIEQAIFGPALTAIGWLIGWMMWRAKVSPFGK